MADAPFQKRFEDSPRQARKAFLPAGTVLQERYKIEHALSLSGSGQVYQASDLRFPGSRWGVKAYKKLPSEDFYRAMRTLASFRHPHLAKVVDYFEEQNLSCMVMELVQGRSLEQILEDTPGPLPERQVLSWGVQCADALICLHRRIQPFTHYRTLSPRKILISAVGELKLAPELPDELDPGSIPGIMGYASPEAFDENKGVDERSDVYTLAAILHRALSGGNPTAIPFVFVSLDPVNPYLDSAVERILEKATQANPGKRTANLGEFRREVYRCLQAVLRIQFHLGNQLGFSDAFWWTLIGILGTAMAAWFYLFYIFSKYR